MAWNLMKKRRDNLEKDKAEKPKLFTDTIESVPADSLRVKAEQRGLDIANAQKDSDEPAISGPFPGGGKGKGTWSGAPLGGLLSGRVGTAEAPAPAPTPAPTPTMTPKAWAEHHEGEAKKYAPGNQSLPAEGTPNLTPQEKKELDDAINMKP